jgi:hypothetical protein
MFSSLSTSVQLILAGVVGILLGLLISTLFSRESKSTSENPLPKDLTDEGYSEAARLLYSPSTKKVIAALDGDFYRDFSQLTPEQKKRVLRLIQSWNEWSGQKPSGQDAAQTPGYTPISTPSKPADDEIYKPFATGAFAFTEETAHKSLEEEPKKTDELADLGIQAPAIVEPIPAVIKIGQTTPASAKKEPLTIIEQINQVIERLAAGTPMEANMIHLAENGQQGVIVWVGSEHFDGVDSVTMPEVKELIKASVAKWEEEVEAKK